MLIREIKFRDARIAIALLAWLMLLPEVSAVAQSIAAPLSKMNQARGVSILNTNGAVRKSDDYVIMPNDVIWLKVYQEDDLETKAKVGRDGTVTVPLLGAVAISGKSVDEASNLIKALLDKRFIVNPQVSLTITEYSKRKFIILGQVQRTGVYEFAGDEKVTLLQAIALAGGYTRLAAPAKVPVQRIERGQVNSYKVNAEAIMKDSKAKQFEVQPDDTITVGSRIF
jgi:polysaccharide export outer membrane protein